MSECSHDRALKDGHLKQWILDHADMGNEGDRKAVKQYQEVIASLREFVRKCECGKAHSVKSYTQMKAAIKAEEE